MQMLGALLSATLSKASYISCKPLLRHLPINEIYPTMSNFSFLTLSTRIQPYAFGGINGFIVPSSM